LRDPPPLPAPTRGAGALKAIDSTQSHLALVERIRAILSSATLEAFEDSWEKRWLVERGAEIISEASRHLPDELKNRNREIPWRKVAGIGNVIRHNYQRIAADVLWKLALEDCRRLNGSAVRN